MGVLEKPTENKKEKYRAELARQIVNRHKLFLSGKGETLGSKKQGASVFSLIADDTRLMSDGTLGGIVACMPAESPKVSVSRHIARLGFWRIFIDAKRNLSGRDMLEALAGCAIFAVTLEYLQTHKID